MPRVAYKSVAYKKSVYRNEWKKITLTWNLLILSKSVVIQIKCYKSPYIAHTPFLKPGMLWLNFDTHLVSDFLAMYGARFSVLLSRKILSEKVFE